MLPDPGEDVCQIKDGAIGGADGMFEGLERDGAKVEGKAFEDRVGAVGSTDVGASRGAKRIVA